MSTVNGKVKLRFGYCVLSGMLIYLSSRNKSVGMNSSQVKLYSSHKTSDEIRFQACGLAIDQGPRGAAAAAPKQTRDKTTLCNSVFGSFYPNNSSMSIA